MNEPEQMMTDAQQIAHLQKRLNQLQDRLRKQTHLANMYAWLHDKEILLATPEGFKHLKGDELTAYIKADMAKDWGVDLDKAFYLTKGRNKDGGDTREES